MVDILDRILQMKSKEFLVLKLRLSNVMYFILLKSFQSAGLLNVLLAGSINAVDSGKIVSAFFRILFRCSLLLLFVSFSEDTKQALREYRYVYGAVEPLTGESCFVVMPYCNTDCMNVFLNELSQTFPNDKIILACDGAAWHKSGSLKIPENVELIFIPPYTPEMNPIEQIWKEIRKRGFKNEVFQTLQKVVDRLCDTICSLSIETI